MSGITVLPLPTCMGCSRCS